MKQNASMALVAAFVLSACGGGGGSDNAAPPAPVVSGTVVTPAPAPAASTPAPVTPPPPTVPVADPAPTTAPAPAPVTPPATPPVIIPPPVPTPQPVVPPVVPPAPAPVSETLPSLAAPQAGSTADIGSVGEGLWVSTASTKGLVFVDSQERHLGYQEGRSGNVPITWNGTWQFAGTSWSFVAGGIFSAEQPVRMDSPLVGNGSFNTRSSFTGAFGTGTELNDLMAYEYSTANALAVASGDLVGQWSSASQTLTIAADGKVSGMIAHASIGSCLVTGTIASTAPGTAKNMFDLTLTGTALQNSYCDMEGKGAQAFTAAITFVNTGQNGVPFYRRALTVLGVVIGGWSTGELLKN